MTIHMIISGEVSDIIYMYIYGRGYCLCVECFISVCMDAREIIKTVWSQLEIWTDSAFRPLPTTQRKFAVVRAKSANAETNGEVFAHGV